MDNWRFKKFVDNHWFLGLFGFYLRRFSCRQLCWGLLIYRPVLWVLSSFSGWCWMLIRILSGMLLETRVFGSGSFIFRLSLRHLTGLCLRVGLCWNSRMVLRHSSRRAFCSSCLQMPELDVALGMVSVGDHSPNSLFLQSGSATIMIIGIFAIPDWLCFIWRDSVFQFYSSKLIKWH